MNHHLWVRSFIRSFVLFARFIFSFIFIVVIVVIVVVVVVGGGGVVVVVFGSCLFVLFWQCAFIKLVRFER